MSKEIEINGRVYPMWNSFIENKDNWIGGTLSDYGDSQDRRIFSGIASIPMVTEIIGMDFHANGTDSAWFEVQGKDFTCGGDVKYLGIVGSDKKDTIEFSGYGGQRWEISTNKFEAHKESNDHEHIDLGGEA